MAALHSSAATLRISGDDLVPEEITRLLGHAPTGGQTKGEIIRSAKSGRERVARVGMWRLEVADREPADLNTQVAEILGKLTGDLTVWREIRRKYRMDLFCGLFMQTGIEGETLSVETLVALGSRGIEVGLDIYAPGDERKDTEPNQPVQSNAGDAPRNPRVVTAISHSPRRV